MSDFDRRYKAAIDEAAMAGLTGNRCDPPVNKLARKLGFQVPPSYYAPFGTNVLLQGVWFGTIWGVLMYFLVWQDQNMPPLGIALSFIGTGTIFGVLMSYLYLSGRKRYKLSKWDDL
ncbi:MAG: DUF6404 family protein [Paracoccaceae bacterium]|jgi:hypothetical protein|nr:hypothetical protein RB2150_13101 [Rhodobacteraceae bacterium HTCC2150]MDG1532110.1 DUF6404 family protein [Paracoccaceae bacterium]